MKKEPVEPVQKQTGDSSGTRSASAKTLFCHKTGRYVDVADPRCQAPGEPCKFRSKCVIYAMQEDEQAVRINKRDHKQYRVTFAPQNSSTTAQPAETLLDVARRADIHITSPCGGEGACGKCKVIVKSGTVKSASTSHLTDAERSAGYVLACQSRPASDLVVEVPPESREDQPQVLGQEGAIPSFESGVEVQEASPSEASSRAPLIRWRVIEVDPPSLEETRADFERISDTAKRAHGVSCRTASLIALRELPSTLRNHKWRAGIYTESSDGWHHVIKVGPPERTVNYGIAVDIGTTTVVVQLMDLRTGRVLGTRGTLNPQTAYGQDVVSRIIHACENRGLDTLHQLVVKTVNDLIAEVCEAYGRCNPSDIHGAVCAGNSTMVHLFLGLPPCTIRREPFVSVTNFPPVVRAQEIGLNIFPAAPLVLVPGISGYVGGDITAGVLASGLAEQDAPCVLVDLGTNGEVVVGMREWMISCASSAGPAFEGGGVRCGMRAALGAIQRFQLSPGGIPQGATTIGNVPARGICGSGLIDTLAELLRAGIIDRAGKFTDAAPTDLVRKGEQGKEFILVPRRHAGVSHDIIITETDIEHIIRSKGAIFTALLILLEKVGLSFQDIHRFYVAGGFGNYLNVKNAVTIGLLPDLPVEQFRFIGNASLAGARMALLDQGQRENLTAIAERMTYLELITEAQFMDRYVASLFLPHTHTELFSSVMGELSRTCK